MFFDEARIAARVQHPNVVSVLDVVESGGELFLVMDYVHGEGLSRLLKRARTLGVAVPPKIAVGVVVDVLYGLHAAHEARSEWGDPLDVVHRDVSPQNIIVGADGIARLLDFGIAKTAERVRSDAREGQLKGKLGYMAPEQVCTCQIDRRTDIYAAAVVLWEALTGERLLPPLEAEQAIAQLLTRAHRAPSEISRGTPRVLDAIVMRALSRTPSDRFATAADMAEELERVMRPATPREIGAWVDRIAAQTLAARAATIAEMETELLMDEVTMPAPPPDDADAIDVSVEERAAVGFC
jgi:serine/threonine-protein kinase